TSITIPNSVTAFITDVFYGCSSLTSITIPNSITSIGDYAFCKCSSLTSITIPKSITSIGNGAFESCTSLKELTIEDSETPLDLSYRLFSNCPIEVLYLGRNYSHPSYPFKDIRELLQLTIGSNVTSIDTYAFNGCTSLKSVIILSPNLNISGDPFMGVNLVSYWGSVKPFTSDNTNGNYFSAEKVFWLSNTEPEYKGTKVTYVSTSNVSTDDNLKRVDYLSSYFTADNGLRYIPISPQNRTAMLIDFDYSLITESLTLPEKVTYKGIEMDVINAGNYCCSHIDGLKHFNIETKLPEIPDGFLYQCTDLMDFVVDRYPERIGKSAFEGCTSLADFIMLDWTTDVKVGINAFSNCGLKDIRIGRQLIYEQTETDSPFANNPTLQSVWITDIPTSIGAYMFKGCHNLKDVYIGDRVMSIDDYAFAGCSSISRFSFGRSVKAIGQEAFSDCIAMKNLYAEPVSPPICGSQALDDINRWECTLHVKSQSKEAYASAPQWKEFLFVDYGFGLSLNVTSMVMEVGETFQLKVVNNSSSGEVTWKSTNEEILTVSDSGFVTAVGSGSASIAAVNSEGLMDNCSIEVVDNAGIKDNFMNEDTFDGHYRVYNIQGILIMDTTEKSLISSLLPGFYIINGKKFIIK
ncbi:MAG: leucine-rich repeat protein, partial [Duncaniella sp.]|nr:leucine-rich repeat protein [Duncaniella sp.]